MNGFQCPFCGQFMSLSMNNEMEMMLNFFGEQSLNTTEPVLQLSIYHCPNPDCNKETGIIRGRNGYIENQTVYVYPSSTGQKFPEYIPQAIRNDYEEACAILQKSPKAAATLARRCLQGMIRDFWGIRKSRLVDEINDLQCKIPADQWKAIDSMRRLGNIGAHMEKDANLIIDIDPDEALNLLHLIELLMNNWYINRYNEQELYASIQAADQQKKDERANQAQDRTPPAVPPQGSNTV